MLRYSNHIFVKRTLAFLCSVFMMTTVFAGASLWTFEPLTPTAIAVPANSTVMVQYRVTNQSSKPHTLTMQPIRVRQGTRQSHKPISPFRAPTRMR